MNEQTRMLRERGMRATISHHVTVPAKAKLTKVNPNSTDDIKKGGTWISFFTVPRTWRNGRVRNGAGS